MTTHHSTWYTILSWQTWVPLWAGEGEARRKMKESVEGRGGGKKSRCVSASLPLLPLLSLPSSPPLPLIPPLPSSPSSSFLTGAPGTPFLPASPDTPCE